MRPKVAFWFRYGPAEHADLFSALAKVVERLSPEMEIHYFGMNTGRPVPPEVARHTVIHSTPFSVNMNSTRDKLLKTLLWIAYLPWLSLRARFLGAKAVYMDETIPLAALITRIFFGRKVCVIVADSFVDIYLSKNGFTRAIANVIKALDYFSWRRLPVIFTHARATCDFLATKGVEPARMRVVYNPVDFETFRPMSKSEARKHFKLSEKDFVIVHHGILHPNKGNDFVIRALAKVRKDIPNLKFLLIGGGPERGNLDELVRGLKMEDVVIFTGRLKTLEEVSLGLNSADVGLVMRIGQETDHFHVTDTLCHNMACALPILSVRLRGIAEIIRDNENGFLFSPADDAEFCEKLKRLAADAQLRKEFGEKALASAKKHFLIDVVARQTAEGIEALMGMNRSVDNMNRTVSQTIG